MHTDSTLYNNSRRLELLDNACLISGNSHPELCKLVSNITGIKNIECDIQYFSNGEIRPIIKESVRGKHIFILQTGTFTNINSKRTINDHIMELLFLVKTCIRSGSESITAIIPCYPYARQDKKDNPRGCISAKDIASFLEFSGVNRIVCFELHCAQIQGFFDIPCDNLYLHDLIKEHLFTNIFEHGKILRDKYIVISPDEGALKKANSFAMDLELPVLVISKERDYTKLNQVENMTIIGDPLLLKGKIAIIIDDMCDTFGTVSRASDLLVKNGVTNVILCITHGIFSGPAIDRMNNCKEISHIVCSNSIPQMENMKRCNKLSTFDISPKLSQVILNLIYGESISQLF